MLEEKQKSFIKSNENIERWSIFGKQFDIEVIHDEKYQLK